MMEVPTYQRRVSIPGSIPYGAPHPGIAAAPAEAAARLGLVVSQEADQQLEARRVNELSERLLDATKELDALDAWADEQTEWKEIVPGYDEKVKDLHTRYSKEIRDPAVRGMFDREFQKMSIRGQARARDLSRKKETDYNRASLLTTLDTYSDLIAQARDFASASEKIAYGRAAIAGAVAAGTITQEDGFKSERDFTEKAQVNFIRRNMLDDPEEVYQGLVSGAYPELDETRKTTLLKESRELSEAEERKRIRILEQAERKAEKSKKEAMEANYGDAIVAFIKGTLNEVQVQRLVAGRLIDPDKGPHLLSLIERGDSEERIRDNPLVVGRIAEKMELGADITEELDAALERHEMNPKTYENLKKQSGARDFKRGLYHVNYALKPSEAEAWAPDKHLRHAEAVDEYSARVASGEPPMVVAKDVVESFTSDIRRTIRGTAAPRFLTGSKTDLGSLTEAERKTAEAFRKGLLSPEDFNREADRINLLKDLAGKLNQNQEAVPEGLSDRAKEALKKR